MGLFDIFSSNSTTQPTTQTVVNNTAPWGSQQPFLKSGFDEAWNNYLNYTPQYYPNDTFIPYSQQTQDALSERQNIALNNQLPGIAANEAANTLSGNYLFNNPYLSQVSDRVTSDVGNAVNSAFAQGGRYGSNAHADTLSQSVADATAPLYMQDYQNERQNMMRAQALAPQANQMLYSNVDQLGQVGGALEAKNYEALQDDINRFNFTQAQPDLQLANYMANVGGNYGQTSTSNSQAVQPLYGGNPIMGGLGGAALGYGLGNEFGYGGAGAALGGLLGLFS